MMTVLPIALLVLAHAGAAQAESPEQLTQRLAALYSQIIPPEGTSKTDIDAVYGEPREIKELKGKGSAADYPMHVYDLLPAEGGQDFRAFLHITYRAGKVQRAGINHICVTKGRPIYAQGSEGEVKQQKEIAAEDRQALADLEAIRTRFREKLDGASWNQRK